MRQEFEIKEEGELGGRVLIYTPRGVLRVGFLLHDEGNKVMRMRRKRGGF